MLFTQLLAIAIGTMTTISQVDALWGLPNPYKASDAASIRIYTQQPITPSQKPKKTLTETMQNIQQTIDAVGTLPSCQKTASWALLHTCETPEDWKSGMQTSGDAYLEAIKDLYAIRITACRHSNANDALPDVCEPLLQIDSDSTSVPHGTISACLEAMNSGHLTQWTTYNRVKLEGLVMCTAMRAQADKDDQIGLLQILFGTMSDVNGVIQLQKEEMAEITSNYRDITSRMGTFQESLLRDNQEIKASMQGFSAELKSSMTEILDTSEALVRGVKASKEEVLQYFSQINTEIQVAQSRSDDTEAEQTKKFHNFFSAVVQMQEGQAYAVNQSLEATHARVYDLTRDIELANDLTGTLAGQMFHLSINLESTIGQVASVQNGTQQIAEIEESTLKTTIMLKENIEDLESSFPDTRKMFWGWVRSTLGQWALIFVYCIFAFIATLCCLWNVFPLLITLIVSSVAGLTLGITFSCVRPPTTILRDLLSSFPVFFSPVLWSVLTVAMISILLWETGKQGCWYISASRSVCQSEFQYSKYNRASRVGRE